MTLSKVVADLQILESQGHIESPSINDTSDMNNIEVVFFLQVSKYG